MTPTPSRRLLALVLGVVSAGVLSACGGAGAADADDAVTIDDAWARATPPGATVGAVYLTATGDDALVGAAVDPAVAAAASLHTTITDSSGGSSMEELQSLDVPADGELVLEPTGSHVMLVDLARPLEDGESFELVLAFRSAGDVTVTVDVRAEAP